MRAFLLVAAGGALGATLRYAAALAVARFHSGTFPLATVLINIVGCLAIGLVLGTVGEHPLADPDLRRFLVTGFLGGFTTFSAFGYETIDLLRRGSTGAALANVALSVGLGLAAVAIGLRFSRLI
ncbi:MAG: fluoride efflux transporter CrcB [Thermoanaerobaculia bacterium]